MENLIITILGQKGQGKTSLTKKILKNLNKFFIIDILNEYDFEKIRTYEQLIKTLIYLLENDFDFKYSIAIDDDKFLKKTIIALWKFAKFYNKEWWLIGEEASYYAGLNKQSDILNFVKYGRHYKVSQIYISRFASEIDRALTSQSDIIISFRQFEPRHLSYLKDFGFDVEKLKKLKRGEFLISGNEKILTKLLKTKTGNYNDK